MLNIFDNCGSLSSIIIPDGVESIDYYAFYDCNSLTSITLGRGIKTIGFEAFFNCRMLENVYCYAEEAPAIGTEAFDDAQIQHILLHVPASSIDSYRSLTPWNRFMDILAFAPYAQCATPSISFVNGILTFDCETEDVEYVTEVRASGRGYFSSNGIRLASLSNQYEVSVRATMPGYIDSEEVTATFTLTPTDLNGDGTLGASDVTLLIDAILNGKH